MADKIDLIVKEKGFLYLIEKLSDIAKISDNIRIKIDNNHILAYGVVGETSILGFKNYLIPTDWVFENPDFDYLIDYIVVGSKKFVNNLKFFDISKKVKFSFNLKNHLDNDKIKIGRVLNITDGSLRMSNVSGEPQKIRDISKETIQTKFAADLSWWNFKINNELLTKIKKISNNIGEEIISINVKDKKVTFSESTKWSLVVGEANTDDCEINFDNKYLDNINISGDDTTFYIFETVILFKDGDESNLLVAFEQSV